jgi:cysteine desulfurase
MIYLDNNATTRPAPRVVEAVGEALREGWGNPLSSHAMGRAARRRVEEARETVAALLGARARDVVFTAGGTESIHLAIRGVAALAPASKRAIVASAVEHDAVLELCEHLERQPDRPWEIRRVGVGPDGVVDEATLAAEIDPSVAIVSVQ